MKLHTMLVAAAVGLTTLTGCIPQSHSNVRQSNDYYYAARGRIENIEQISTGSGQASGVGMVGGAVVGGLLGNQIGKGSGKTVATIAGVAAGAYGGNEAEKYYSRNKTEYRVTVRTDDGRVMSMMQNDIGGMRVGDRVRVSQDKIMLD